MLDAMSKIIPVILLLALGYTIKHRRLANEEHMAILKKGIIYLTLPAVFFLTFKNMELKASHLAISLVMFIFLWLLYYIGVGLKKILPGHSDILPFMVTGSSFGLLGLPLIVGVYGVDNAGAISIYGIGHEFFAGIVYLALLKSVLGGEKFSKDTVVSFAKSPLILSITAGIIVNLTRFDRVIDGFFLLKGIELTLESLAAVTTPLILMVVGYGIRIEKAYIKPAIMMVVLRLTVFLTVGFVLRALVLNPMFGGMTPLENLALFTFLVLPPPYSSAIFIYEFNTVENTYIANNVLVIGTLLCVMFFGVGVLIAGV